MTFYSTSVNALSPANSAVHKYLHSSIKDRKLRSRISYTVPERFTSNLKYITPAVENCKELDDAPEESSCTDSVGRDADVP